MAAFTTLIAAAALATAAAGTAISYVSQKKQAQAAADYAQQSADIQNDTAAKTAAANNAALEKQQALYDLQEKQMKLDAARRKRELIRQEVAARSAALSTTTNQGASYGSALPGVYGSISGFTGNAITGVNQGVELGSQAFDLNRGILDDYRNGANIQAAGSASLANLTSGYSSLLAGYGALGSLGGGLASLGGAVLSNVGTISRVGTYFGGSSSPRLVYGAAGSYGVPTFG